MKYIITESQFKRLIKNIIKEIYNPFDDPKALALINHLIEKHDEEVGITNIEEQLEEDFCGMTPYKLDDGRIFGVGTYNNLKRYLQGLPYYPYGINWGAVQNNKSGDYYIHQISGWIQ